MWISKKKWKALEKRVADLEGQVQSQPDLKVEDIRHEIRKHDKDIKRFTFF
jgi:hypothetical protein